jgi:hypothetical protein
MSTSEEAPALIQYACERCKTRFVLPPSSRKLSIAGKVRAISMGIGRGLTKHEGLGVAYDTARRQLLSKMDDEAYQSFVQSFRFCHECRQFVCNECWSTSRRSCLTCVAKSMTGTARPRPPFAPTGPEIPRPAISSAAVPVRKGRLRRDVALVALALAIILVSLEAGILLVGMIPPAGPAAAGATATPTAEITAPPTATATAAGSPSATLSPSPSMTASASASASATTTGTPTPTPTRRITPPPGPTAAPTPTPVPPVGSPTILCTSTYGGTAPYDLSCSIGNYSPLPGDTYNWLLDAGNVSSASSLSIKINDIEVHSLQVVIHRSGTSNGYGSTSGPPW